MITAPWIVWAFLCAFAVRLGIVFVLKKQIGGASYLVAYAAWVMLLVIGLITSDALGFQMYGFDAADPKQAASRLILLYTPFGFPTLVGAPIVLILDALRGLWRVLKPKLTPPRTH